MKLVKENFIQIVGVMLGAIIGYLYWKNTICDSNACAINSTPFPLTINFAILGYLLAGFIKPFLQKLKSNGKN